MKRIMTIDFCFEIRIVKPRTTVDKPPVDFNEHFQVFMPTFSKHLKRLFLSVVQKPLWRRVDEIFLQHCMPICPSSASDISPTSVSVVEWSLSMLKSMVHENRNFTDAHVAFYRKIVFNS